VKPGKIGSSILADYTLDIGKVWRLREMLNFFHFMLITLLPYVWQFKVIVGYIGVTFGDNSKTKRILASAIQAGMFSSF
jgi:hypothetical protein